MKRFRDLFFTLTLTLLLPFQAMATNPPSPTPSGTSSSANATANPRSTAVSAAKSKSNANAHSQSSSVATGGAATSSATGGNASAAGGNGGAGGSANQTQTANGGLGGAGGNQTQSATNAGNAQNTAITSVYEERLQAPSISAPPVYASGPCAYGWSAGLSVPGAGISGGKSKPDTACDRRELARVLTPLNPQLALKILCADPIAAAVATPADCTYIEQESRHVVSEAPPSSAKTVEAMKEVFPTKTEVKETVDRAFKRSQSK